MHKKIFIIYATFSAKPIDKCLAKWYTNDSGKHITNEKRFTVMKEIYKNEYRESLLDRLIKRYGFEHPAVVEFARQCEMYPYSTIWDGVLCAIVEDHEAGEYDEVYAEVD